MITDKHFHYLYRSQNAITNVLQGLTADGTEQCSSVSFTNDELARKAAAHQLRLILCHCHRVLDLEDVTPLTVKFLWHLTRTGKQTSEAILLFPIVPLIHAIKHYPHMVRGKGSIISILRKHQQHLERERAKQWLLLEGPTPERILLWTDGLYTLKEATDPRHLLNDTLVLGHCVGSLFNRIALEHLKLSKDHPDAIHYLHYWMKIKSGESRILTLFEADMSLVTIDFHPHTQIIIGAQGKTTPMGQIVPLPAEVKTPLFEAMKVLPIRRAGGAVLKSLVFEPYNPKVRLQRVTRFTAL